MPNGPSRRDFVKAAVAASLGGVAASAEEPKKSSGNGAGKAESGAHHAEKASAIAFPRVHTGNKLARISYPLGGIGTGGIGLGGRGNLQDWQIFNRPDIGNALEYAFPSLWMKARGEAPYSVVLERRLLPPYDLQQQGLGFANVPGLPRLAEAKFSGSFPTARIDFQDKDCPLHVALEAFSPFQPLDADASGLPCAVLSYEVHNPGASAAEVVIAWSIANPVGVARSRKNEAKRSAHVTGVLMTDPHLGDDDAMKGSFVLAALAADGAVAMQPNWSEAAGGQHAGAQHFWDEFSKSGMLYEPAGATAAIGNVSIRQTIPAGESRRFRFLLAWYFPNRTAERCGWTAPRGKEKALLGNYYATQYKDAWAVAEHTAENLPMLEQRTRAFVAVLQQSTLPDAVKEAASANLSTLVSNTSFRIADGSFQGFEGCGDHAGMGFGTCTHVWNYEVATQFMFPSLARSMRETSFGAALNAEGHMDFRHLLPTSEEHWKGAAAADGQMGQIVKLYLDWVQSGDDAWLRRQWPGAKQALAYAWRPGGWDERRSGVMDGVQHNTYDIEFFGPNPLSGIWYLAALRAASKMADAMGDTEMARDCARMALEGGRWMDANLFNGEYYIQQIREIAPDAMASGLQMNAEKKSAGTPPFQMGAGCMADQLVGQYMATVAGLGDLLDAAHIRKTLESIYRYNAKRSFAHHSCVQRTYVLNDEAALTICEFPKGGKPEIPVRYAEEAWSGVEYAAATLMLAYGMTEQGIECIENIRARYDGEKRNPFDETEFGRHYARAMASWAAIPVLSGFRCDARTNRIEIAPAQRTDVLRSLWTASAGWGSFELTAQGLKMSVVAGAVRVQELCLASSGHTRHTVLSGRETVEHAATMQDGRLVLRFVSPIVIDENAPLHVQFSS